MRGWEQGLLWFYVFVQVVSLVCTVVRQRRLTAAVRREQEARTAEALAAWKRGGDA